MSAFIAGFICSLILAALLVAWFAYCMFVKERHKSESHQYNISDLRRRNYEISQEQDIKEDKKVITAGIFILPSRRKQDEEYEKRPDYPESPVPVQPPVDRLISTLYDNIDADVHYKDVSFDIDSSAPYQSDV